MKRLMALLLIGGGLAYGEADQANRNSIKGALGLVENMITNMRKEAEFAKATAGAVPASFNFKPEAEKRLEQYSIGLATILDLARKYQDQNINDAEINGIVAGIRKKIVETSAELPALGVRLRKAIPDLSKQIAEKMVLAKDLDAMKKAITERWLVDDLEDVANTISDHETKLMALELALDDGAMGHYLQTKLESLLRSREFCAAMENCQNVKEGRIPEHSPKLDGVFQRKTH
ncbi:hypothetical protein K2X33_10515 [bacterium]|nr:hypothetical protein [bacterium]